MNLPKCLTTVTTFSKIIAATLFVTLPIIGFVLGMKYQAATNLPIIRYITTEKIIKQPQEDTERNLVKRCGAIPDEALIEKGHFDVVDGPSWSPDCRHIAWSLWESGTSYLGNDPEILDSISKNVRVLSGKEGVFVFNDVTKKIVKINSPKNLNETPIFKKWLDRDVVVFTANGDEYNYNIIEDSTASIKKSN